MRWLRRRRGRIAVLFHERQEPGRAVYYAIHHLAEIWRSDGLDVEYLYGVERFVPADVAIVHVDLSVVPDEYLDFARRYPVAVNDRVKDIRKSTYSTLRVKRDSDHQGPVIVKSDYNYAGVPERVLGVPDAPAEFEGQTEYSVYDSLADVPPHVLDDERLIVERFVPELEDGRYHVRTLDLLGDRYTSLRVAASHHVVTDSTLLEFEEVEPPPAIWELRERHGLGYGKLDYVIHDSEPILLDVNKTTGASATRPGANLERTRRHRAAGIYSYLR